MGFGLVQSLSPYLRSRAVLFHVKLSCVCSIFPASHTPQSRRISSALTSGKRVNLGWIDLRAGNYKKMVHVLDSIQLTAKEQQIFNTLLKTVEHAGLATQLRVAGGWVRDKLLGKESSDIDIALDNILGKDFCEKINDYLESIGEKAHNVGVIMSNPEQSKHLETARMRVCGVEIDFVNLRSETYADHSRIPSMEFGTAEEDAFRRDLTINSLFYNINTSSVEDYTKRGLSDLKAGVVSTPLPPEQTFLDDPLRVLRAVRFGARFDFELDEQLRNAASLENVKYALATKVSPERIGHEVDLMLLGNQPVRAVQLLHDVGLLAVILKLPQRVEPTVSLAADWYRESVDYMQTASGVLDIFGISKLPIDDRRILFLTALLLPIRHVDYRDAKGRLCKASTGVIRDTLKLKANDADKVLAIHGVLEEFIDTSKLLLSIDKDSLGKRKDIVANQRVKAGFLLRKIKGLWRAALIISSILENSSTEIERMTVEQKAKRCIAVENMVLELGLDNIWDLRPLLDGRAIMDVLGLKTGGPEVKKWKDQTTEWQLANLEGTRDECVDWLKSECAKRIRAS